ncbi:uncharacterized protein LOC120562328, partial [Scomber scombrus]
MDPYPEYEDRGARSKRYIRPPARYADYEVDHLDYIGQRYREEVETTPQEGKVRMTSLTSAYDSSPPSRLQRREAILQEMDLCYGAESQQHIPENQLAPLLFPDGELRERLQDHSTPLSATLHPRHSHDHKAELEDIRYERHLIQQTQQRMSSDLVELRALRTEMRQLVDAVRNLQSPSPLHTSKPELKGMQPQPPVGSEPDGEEEDDWPAPPPWPEPLPDEEAMSPTTSKLLVGQPQVQHSTGGGPPVPRPRNGTAPYSSPWFKPAQPPPWLSSCSPAEPKYPTAYGGHSSEPRSNPVPPQQPPYMSWTQPPPSRTPQGR